MKEKDSRAKEITKTSVIGILANVVLAAFKALVGIMANSIAIILDSVNNLTDALSSVITIIGIKVAKRPPDKKHPFGHGRIEYFSAIIIAAIVITAGISSLIESIKNIFAFEKPDYSTITIVIICVAIVVKIVLGRFVKNKGIRLNSDALIASGSDALFDAIISATTLVGAVFYFITGFPVDGIVGAIISVFIIKAGIEMFARPFNQIVGFRPDSEVTKAMKKSIKEIDGVHGAYDLVLHNYGPDAAIGSVHIEVDDTLTAKEIHILTKKVQDKILREFSTFLTVGIYAVNTSNDSKSVIERKIREFLDKQDPVIGTHGFFIDEEKKLINFDMVMTFDLKDRANFRKYVDEQLKSMFPEYTFVVNIDTDYTD